MKVFVSYTSSVEDHFVYTSRLTSHAMLTCDCFFNIYFL